MAAAGRVSLSFGGHLGSVKWSRFKPSKTTSGNIKDTNFCFGLGGFCWICSSSFVKVLKFRLDKTKENPRSTFHEDFHQCIALHQIKLYLRTAWNPNGTPFFACCPPSLKTQIIYGFQHVPVISHRYRYVFWTLYISKWYSLVISPHYIIVRRLIHSVIPGTGRGWN